VTPRLELIDLAESFTSGHITGGWELPHGGADSAGVVAGVGSGVEGAIGAVGGAATSGVGMTGAGAAMGAGAGAGFGFGFGIGGDLALGAGFLALAAGFFAAAVFRAAAAVVLGLGFAVAFALGFTFAFAFGLAVFRAALPAALPAERDFGFAPAFAFLLVLATGGPPYEEWERQTPSFRRCCASRLRSIPAPVLKKPSQNEREMPRPFGPGGTAGRSDSPRRVELGLPRPYGMC
jgi:hypothetical protein